MFTIDRGAYLYGLCLYTIRGMGYAYESRVIHTVYILEDFIQMSHLGILSYISPPGIWRDNTHLGIVHRMCKLLWNLDYEIWCSHGYSSLVRVRWNNSFATYCCYLFSLMIEQFVEIWQYYFLEHLHQFLTYIIKHVFLKIFNITFRCWFWVIVKSSELKIAAAYPIRNFQTTEDNSIWGYESARIIYVLN